MPTRLISDMDGSGFVDETPSLAQLALGPSNPTVSRNNCRGHDRAKRSKAWTWLGRSRKRLLSHTWWRNPEGDIPMPARIVIIHDEQDFADSLTVALRLAGHD